jgi:drug/metabolite transporter (DMT)-like permease
MTASSSVAQVAAYLAMSFAMVAATIVVAAVIAFFLARKFGGTSRAKRKIIFLLVGGFGLLCAGGAMFLRLYSR